MKKYSIILAADEKNGIGKNNTIPWRLKKEQAYFKEITLASKNENKKNAVVMGRKTWESIPKSVRPLPGRVNFILSSSYKENPNIIQENVLGFNSFEKCHEYITKSKDIDRMFIIGGSYLYNLVLDSQLLEKIYLTRIHGNFNCDVFFSDIPGYFKIIKTSETFTENDIEYQMFEYKNKKHFRKEMLKPGMIIGGIFVLLGILFLLFQTFSSSQDTVPPSNTQIQLEKKTEPEEPIVEPSSPIDVIDNTTEKEESLENKEIDIVSENPPDIEELAQESILENTETDTTEETISKGSFRIIETSLSGVNISYPETDIQELQEEITSYIISKGIEYKILLFNQKNSGIEGEIVLDYEVINETNEEIVIRFTDRLENEVISTKEITYTKK